MAVLPTKILEIEFDAGTWTDVTADHVDLATRRGRNRELGAFETGTLTFTLRNDGRKYDPDNAAGPYYGKLRPNRRVRLRATYNAVTYPVFQGYLDKITQVYGGPNDATAVFEASDIFKLLNRVELPVSVYGTEIAADTPLSWYRLDDPEGSTTAREAVAGRDAPVYGTGVTFGADGLVTRDGGTAMTTAGGASTPHGLSLPAGATPTGTGNFAVEFILATTQAPTNSVTIIEVTGGASADYFRVGLSAIFIGASGIELQQGTTVSGTFGTVNDGAPHHVVVSRSGTTATVYIDGASAGTFTVPVALGPTVTFGSPATNAVNAYQGTLDELAWYPAALSSARVLAHYNARKVGGQWAGDLPGPRIGRILDLAAVPTADRNLDAGTTTLQPTDLGGDALGYAQKVEETEQGELFVTRDGKVRFIGRQAAVTGGYLTSAFTLVDDDSGAGIPYRDVGSDVDEAVLVTRATVSREGGVAVTYGDAAAQAEFKVIDAVHDGLLHDDDGYSLSYARWIVNTHRTPASRVGAVGLELTRDPAAMYPAVLAVELGDQVTYKRKPQNTGAVISLAMRVEAIAHATDGEHWATTLQLSPFNLGEGGWPVWVWGTTKWGQQVWGI